jgi:hypothetical protein
MVIESTDGAVVDAIDNDTASLFAVVGKDRNTRVFDLWSPREQICRWPNEEWDDIVLFSADGAWLLAGSETKLALLKTDGMSVRVVVRANRAWTKPTIFSHDGARVGIATRDGRVSVVDARTGQELSISREKRASVSALAFSPDARAIATGHDDGAVSIWSADNGRLVRRLEACGGSVKTVGFSPDGALIAAAGWHAPALISSTGDGTLLHQIVVPETPVVDRLVFLPNSRHLLMPSEVDSSKRGMPSPEAQESGSTSEAAICSPSRFLLAPVGLRRRVGMAASSCGTFGPASNWQARTGSGTIYSFSGVRGRGECWSWRTANASFSGTFR